MLEPEEGSAAVPPRICASIDGAAATGSARRHRRSASCRLTHERAGAGVCKEAGAADGSEPAADGGEAKVGAGAKAQRSQLEGDGAKPRWAGAAAIGDAVGAKPFPRML